MVIIKYNILFTYFSFFKKKLRHYYVILLLYYITAQYNISLIFEGIPGKPGLDGERGAVGPPGTIGSQVSTNYTIQNLN